VLMVSSERCPAATSEDDTFCVACFPANSGGTLLSDSVGRVGPANFALVLDGGYGYYSRYCGCDKPM
jgi:hypothetical protein